MCSFKEISPQFVLGFSTSLEFSIVRRTTIMISWNWSICHMWCSKSFWFFAFMSSNPTSIDTLRANTWISRPRSSLWLPTNWIRGTKPWVIILFQRKVHLEVVDLEQVDQEALWKAEVRLVSHPDHTSSMRIDQLIAPSKKKVETITKKIKKKMTIKPQCQQCKELMTRATGMTLQ